MDKLDLKNMALSSAERDVFRQLFFQGPVWDGDLISKSGRDGLVRRGLAVRCDGWQTLSEDGFVTAVHADYGREKERWQHQRRAALGKEG